MKNLGNFKILLKSLTSIRTTALVLCMIYMIIYVVIGQEGYQQEIMKLQQFEVFGKQFLILAIAIYIATVSYYYIKEKQEEVKTMTLKNCFAAFMLAIGIGVIPIILVENLLKEHPVFTKTFLVFWTSIISIFALVMMMKTFYIEVLINKKLKERKSKRIH